ncbi:MAG: TIR domain-containing protein [Sandaracinobacter sp.]
MPDVFLSYTHADRDKARLFAEGLESAGLEVWWDVTVQLGDTFDEATETALRTAGAVVVLWSPRSVASRWVRSEASVALRQGTLVPAMIEFCARPVMFELTQTADLCHWQGEPDDALFRRLVREVLKMVGRDDGSAPERASRMAAPHSSQRDGPKTPFPQLHQLTTLPPSEISTPLELAAKAEFRLPAKPSIAVMPFASLSGEDQDFFADGMVEEISTVLSRFSSLFVIAGQSSLSYRGTTKTAPDIARELGVRYLLEGSVRRAGGKVRISVKLVDALVGELIWADRFDDALEDVFELQDRIANAVVSTIDSTITDAEMRRSVVRPTNSPDAYELSLRANAKLARYDSEAVKEALAFAERAVELDPNYAWAVATASFCHATLALNLWAEDRMGAVAAGLAHAERAAQIAGDDLMALTVAAGAFATLPADITRASALIERAMKLNPEKAFVLFWGGTIDVEVGNFARALERLEKAARLDPRSIYRPWQLMNIGTCLLGLDRYEEAAVVQEEAMRLLPNYPVPHMVRGTSLALAGRTAEAREALSVLQRMGGVDACRSFFRTPALQAKLNQALELLGEAPTH